MKKHLSTIILILVFCIGLSLLLYPSVSDYWNSHHQSEIIAGYADAVSKINKDQYAGIWQRANTYNKTLAEQGNTWTLTEEEKEDYLTQLDIAGNGVMSYIEIPAIDCHLPVYHGTEEAVLQVAVGHYEGSSLPIGGESTHCVLTGHRGLPSAKLFSKLDQLVVGDVFFLQTLDETLTYEIDQILIVLPYEMDELKIQKGEDLCTLVTCTPYGVNSHRLLVRGHRIENQEQAKSVRVTSEAIQIEPLLVAPAVAAPMLLILLIILLIPKEKKQEEEEL